MILLLLFIALCLSQECSNLSCYNKMRDDLVNSEADMQLGNGNSFPVVDEWIQKEARSLYDSLLNKNFRELIPQIESTFLYQILAEMPKGALLHTHGIVDMRTVISIGTYRDDCWVDLRENSESFGFFKYSTTNIPGFFVFLSLYSSFI